MIKSYFEQNLKVFTHLEKESTTEPSSESSTSTAEKQKDNNDNNKKAPKRQNSKESKSRKKSQTSTTSDTLEEDEMELLQMRKALLEQTASKKNLISPIKSTENQTPAKEPDLKIPVEATAKPATKKKIQNPPIVDLTVLNDEKEQKIKQKVIPVLNISKTPDIIVPGEM